MPQFGRLLTAMVTPFTADLALDVPRAVELAERLIAEGSDGLVVSGTTGESPTLTKDEKLALFAALKAAVGGRASIIAGTGSYSTAETIALSQAAEAQGVDALLLVNPYYNKPNQEGLYAHFMAVADATKLPILLYNHPGRTGVCIEPETLAKLAAHPRIVGVKDSSGNLDLVTAYKRSVPADFMIYCGDDPLTLPFLAVGACGVVSVSSHVAGREIKAMLEAWFAGDRDRALEGHLATYAISKVLFCAPSPSPTKHALAHLGFPVGSVRLPLVAMNAADEAKVASAVDALNGVRA